MEKARYAGFTPKMKLADLVEENYKLLPVLDRLGIRLGFGEKSVAEGCAEAGISPSFFLLICNIHTYDGYHPDSSISATGLAEIVSYLHNSHEYYKNKQLPRLQQKLALMVEECDPVQGKLIQRFFENYRKEIENHFEYEENTVFPYVRMLACGEKAGGYSIEQFEKNHSNIDEKLNDLKSIILKYLPAKCDTPLRSEVLFDIFQLEEDLDKHTMMENKLLIPLVAAAEGRIRS